MGRTRHAAGVEALRRLARAVGPDGAVGLTAAALVAAGAWGLAGWPWAALSIGAPLGAFYLFAEARKLGSSREG